MYKYLFFDDQKLFNREKLERAYGTPELIADSIFHDGISSTSLRTPFVFKCDDGRYRMIYQGKIKEGTDHCFIAVSDDGIHFVPEDVTDRSELADRVASHELFKIPSGEIAEVIEDNYNDASERYKMLLCEVDGENFAIHGVLLTSPDLIRWTKVEGVEWNGGAEPITGIVYNKKRECFTILLRPDWGVRRVGYVETKDWRTYTKYEMCLQADSLDQPLDELYGMPAMEYYGHYIGFPIIYRGFKGVNNAKFFGGTIESELAYSWDARHWQRSLRTPFISGMTEESEKAFGYKNYLLWASCFRIDDNGDVLIYSSVSGLEHGTAFSTPDMGRIAIWRVKKDRFISLNSGTDEGLLCTRENVWHSGEAHINLKAEKATVAVYMSSGNDNLGISKLVDGYSHEDCIAFSGDSTDWVPVFRSGKTLDDLKGNTVAIEIKVTNGSLYSITADCKPAMNLEGARYRKFGTKPTSI